MDTQEPQGLPESQDEELREEDVTRGDVLDDRVAEGDGLDDEDAE